MALTADAQGRISGTFTIPEGIPAGSKLVEFRGRGGSRATAAFVGQGHLQTSTLRQVTTIGWAYDPLAQTFSLAEDTQLAGVDIWFTAKGERGVTLQIRETVNGYPARTVIAQKAVAAEDIVVTGGGHTRILLDAPVQCLAGAEYALVVLCDDAVTELSIAELGKFDAKNQQFVTSQPYTIGVLFSSSNASTWTAHQDKDMTFRLLAASFSSQTRDIGLGEVDVDGATDIMLLSVAETPSASTRVEYTLTLPGGEDVTVSENQPVRLPAATSGRIAVHARLKGTASKSPLLWPGTQLVTGAARLTADYVSRAVPASGAARAVLIYDAYIPSGASVTAYLRKDQSEFQPVPLAARQHGDEGADEFRHEAEGSLLEGAETVQLKLELTGTPLNRPEVGNIRLLLV